MPPNSQERLTRLHAVVVPERPSVQVVFIHGLNEEWSQSWGFDQKISWRDYIELQVPSAAVWSLDYEVVWTKLQGESMPLVDRATNVLATFDSELSHDLPLILVGHSYGGLLIKEMTRLSHEGLYPWVVEKLTAVAFSAVPHNGSEIPKYVDALRIVLQPGPAINELEQNAASLRSLDGSFRRIYEARREKRQPITVTAFTEKKNYKGVRVVSDASSNPYLTKVDPIPIDADHITIMQAPYPPDVRVGPLVDMIERVAIGARARGGDTSRSADKKEIAEELKKRAPAPPPTSPPTTSPPTTVGTRNGLTAIVAIITALGLVIAIASTMGVWNWLTPADQEGATDKPPASTVANESESSDANGAVTDTASSDGEQAPQITLVMGWEAAFCETADQFPECGSMTQEHFYAAHLSFRGLYAFPLATYCGLTPELEDLDEARSWMNLPELGLSIGTGNSLRALMPGLQSGLDRHAWFKHGTCVSSSPDEYFSMAVQLVQAMHASSLSRWLADRVGETVTVAQLRAHADAAFGKGAGTSFTMQCIEDGSRRLLERIEVSLIRPAGENIDLSELLAGNSSGSSCDEGIVDPFGNQ